MAMMKKKAAGSKKMGTPKKMNGSKKMSTKKMGGNKMY
jgi:hypothetical protein